METRKVDETARKINEKIAAYCADIRQECVRLNELARVAGDWLTDEDYGILLAEKLDICCMQMTNLLQDGKSELKEARELSEENKEYVGTDDDPDDHMIG